MSHGRSFTSEVVSRLSASFEPNIRWAPGGGPERHGQPLSEHDLQRIAELVAERLKR